MVNEAHEAQFLSYAYKFSPCKHQNKIYEPMLNIFLKTIKVFWFKIGCKASTIPWLK